MSSIVKVVLTPPRVEFVRELVRECEDACSLVLELPQVESLKPYLEDRATVDDVLSELELDYPLFLRELLRAAKRLHSSGVEVLALDPYQEIAVNVKMRLFLKKGLEQLERDYTARYIAMLELNIGKILSQYYSTPREEFDRLVDLTIRYAKFDAERLRMKSEFRARKIAELVERGKLKLPAVIHTSFMNTIFPSTLARKLEAHETKQVDLYSKVSRRLFNVELTHPGRELTRIFLEHTTRDQDKIRLLAAQTLIMVSLYPKSEVIPKTDSDYPLLRKDYEIITGVLSSLDTYEKCREYYFKNILNKR